MRLGKKIKQKAKSFRYVGYFLAKEAIAKNMRLVTGTEGALKEGNLICLYWLVDESDGIICDVKYQVFGHPVMIAICEIVSELCLRKNYDQVSRITSDLIEQSLREKKESFPKEYDRYFNSVISAIDHGVHQCLDIPFARTYEGTPLDFSYDAEKQVEGFTNLSKKDKLKVIETIIDKEIRPYIELDAGGINLVDLIEDKEVIISYEGSCTSCHASTGSTLSAIDNILKVRIDQNLFVTPKL